MRDRILGRIGTQEAIIPIDNETRSISLISMQWRKPLSIEEINRMAPTEEVRMRPGRP